jgi:hypothetical protein
MANTTGRLQLSVYDNNGNKGSILSHVNFDDAQTAAQLSAEIAAYATAFGAVSTAGIRQGSFDVVNKAVARAPLADANLPTGFVLDFSNGTDATIYGQYTPSRLDTLVLVGGAIDVGNGAFIAWRDLLLNAAAGAYNFANTHSVNNGAFTKAFRSDRKRSRSSR